MPDITHKFHWIERPETGIFVRRLNRFAAEVTLSAAKTKVYLPNSGRLEELLIPGNRVICEYRRNSGKTHHDLLLVETPSYPDNSPIWACLDSRMPPKLLSWSISGGLIPDLEPDGIIRTEPAFSGGRLDLAFEQSGRLHLVETKSCNLVDSSGIARFPDAPTSRGTGHIEKLISLSGGETIPHLFFIVMRSDAIGFAPFTERDPEFCGALLRANNAGVDIRAIQFSAGIEFQFMGELDISLRPPKFPGFWPPMD